MEFRKVVCQELAALIAIGYPDIEPEAPRRKSVEDLLSYR